MTFGSFWEGVVYLAIYWVFVLHAKKTCDIKVYEIWYESGRRFKMKHQ